MAREKKKGAGVRTPVETLEPALRTALEQDEEAKRAFLALSPAQQRSLVVNVKSMTSNDMRARLIERVVAGLRDGTI